MDSNFWNERYSESGWAYGVEPNDFLKEQVLSVFGEGGGKGKKALCLGEGEGRNAAFLAENGFETFAIDISSVGLKKLETLAASKGLSINTEVADLNDYQFAKNGKWDLVISIWVPLPPPLRVKVHENICKCINTEGVFIFEGYSPQNIGRGTGGPQTPELCVTFADIVKDFSTLDKRVAQEVERDVVEGKYHSAQQKSAVVQYVGCQPAGQASRQAATS
jgi:SAM-dependent methyltransferase